MDRLPDPAAAEVSAPSAGSYRYGRRGLRRTSLAFVGLAAVALLLLGTGGGRAAADSQTIDDITISAVDLPSATTYAGGYTDP